MYLYKKIHIGLNEVTDQPNIEIKLLSKNDDEISLIQKEELGKGTIPTDLIITNFELPHIWQDKD